MAENVKEHKGTVTSVFKDYGFIAADDISDQDVYFKPSWFRGSPPLKQGDPVSFTVVEYDNGLQAKDLRRQGSLARDQQKLKPITDDLLQWSYLGYLPNTLNQLRALALSERWEFQNTPEDPDHPFPILHSYLRYTFERLVLEGKVRISANEQFAAFNTGLVDSRYETIFAVFQRNEGASSPWQLAEFCIAGEGSEGRNLVRNFTPLPSPAHYFDSPTDLLYDARKGSPELDWEHVVIERIDRFPPAFLEDNCPAGFELRDVRGLSWQDRRQYRESLGQAIQDDKKTYRRIMNRVRDAVQLSIKRVSWNFKTAVPQYYPRVQQLQLLLPLCLVSDECVDLALAVEITPAGGYLGHTTLPLDWAYRNARLVCRPDSDWLEPDAIQGEELFEEA